MLTPQYTVCNVCSIFTLLSVIGLRVLHRLLRAFESVPRARTYPPQLASRDPESFESELSDVTPRPGCILVMDQDIHPCDVAAIEALMASFDETPYPQTCSSQGEAVSMANEMISAQITRYEQPVS